MESKKKIFKMCYSRNRESETKKHNKQLRCIRYGELLRLWKTCKISLRSSFCPIKWGIPTVRDCSKFLSYNTHALLGMLLLV